MEDEDQPQLSVQKLITLCKRRIWWIVVPVLLGPLLAIGISYKVTPVYTSQAFVLVEQPKVSDKFVTPMITDELDTRLMTLKEQILSRSRLEPIIERLGLYKEDGRETSMEDKVERLRKSIDVKTIRPDGSNRVFSGFYITASTDNARSAQHVCTEILSMFMAENLKVRQQHAAGTTEFLAAQLVDSKRKLDEHDAKLAEFKRRYLGQLPSDEQRNLELLTSTRTRLEVVNQELSQIQQQKIVQESMLSQQVSSRKTVQLSANPTGLQGELTALQQQLASLQSRYTDEHPDVIKVKAQIAAMQKQLRQSKAVAETPQSKDDTVVDAPEIGQTRVALRLTEENIRNKRTEQARLGEQVRALEGRLQLSPGVEEQYKALTRDYESALQFYNELLNKKTQSEMATDLERRQEGEQFGVMDAPDLPVKPTFPNRLKFAMTGLVAGLGLGVGLVFMIERREDFIRTDEDVVRVLGLPVLIGIPEVKRRLFDSSEPISLMRTKQHKASQQGKV
jgi:polysaccharide chain length determinant protein (PEP-CTERM system associated)